MTLLSTRSRIHHHEDVSTPNAGRNENLVCCCRAAETHMNTQFMARAAVVVLAGCGGSNSASMPLFTFDAVFAAVAAANSRPCGQLLRHLRGRLLL
jgi:hypothetical protein